MSARLFKKEVEDCSQCPNCIDLMCEGDMVTGGEFVLHCDAIRDSQGEPMFLASPIHRDRIVKEWREDSLVRLEIEVPDCCPLPVKDDSKEKQ